MSRRGAAPVAADVTAEPRRGRQLGVLASPPAGRRPRAFIASRSRRRAGRWVIYPGRADVRWRRRFFVSGIERDGSVRTGAWMDGRRWWQTRTGCGSTSPLTRTDPPPRRAAGGGCACGVPAWTGGTACTYVDFQNAEAPLSYGRTDLCVVDDSSSRVSSIRFREGKWSLILHGYFAFALVILMGQCL